MVPASERAIGYPRIAPHAGLIIQCPHYQPNRKNGVRYESLTQNKRKLMGIPVTIGMANDQHGFINTLDIGDDHDPG